MIFYNIFVIYIIYHSSDIMNVMNNDLIVTWSIHYTDIRQIKDLSCEIGIGGSLG